MLLKKLSFNFVEFEEKSVSTPYVFYIFFNTMNRRERNAPSQQRMRAQFNVENIGRQREEARESMRKRRAQANQGEIQRRREADAAANSAQRETESPVDSKGSELMLLLMINDSFSLSGTMITLTIVIIKRKRTFQTTIMVLFLPIQ